jgi:tetratricopeptide (TPR) repeat protein
MSRSWNPLLLIALGMTHALGVPSASAQDGADAVAESDAGVVAIERNVSRDPKEIEAYRGAKERFTERATEFQSDVARLVQERKKEELAKISQGYDLRVMALEERERAQREVAIRRLQDFLRRYPSVSDSDNVRFRLAELYYEQAVTDWVEAQERFRDVEAEYDQKFAEAERVLEETGDPTLLEQLEELQFPMKDLAPSIELYQQIVSRNIGLEPEDRWQHLDRAFYSLGFAFMDTQSVQYDLKRARMSFEELLKVAGEDSQLADAAHMFLGKILFEEEKRYEDALEEYGKIVAKGPASSYYQDASFQLAWIYYKLAVRVPEYEEAALALFTKILDESQQAMRESGRESDYARDARLNLARMLADRADRDFSTTSAKVAQAFFSRIGERPWERDVFLSLAEVLAGCIPAPDPCPPGTVTLGRYLVDEAIEVYELLQTDPRWISEPDNPNYQMKLIWLLPRKDVPDLQNEIPEQQRLLVDRYGETVFDPLTGEEKPNPWWVANRNNADALDNVRRFVEGSLSQVAQGLLLQAQENRDPNLFRQSADKFREYLDKFPIADNFYLNQWYLANALMNAAPKDQREPAQPYEDAIREFTSLLHSRENHPYGDGAVYRMVDARREILAAKVSEYGPLDQRPPGAELERTETTAWGKSIDVYKLSPDHEAYINAMDRALSYPFEEPFDASVPDYREAMDENRAYMLYTPAMILAIHNRFDEARARAERVLAEVPDTKEASFAANIIVLSYNSEGNLEEVRNQTRRFATMSFDDPAMKEKFGSMYQDASFIQC